MEAITLREHGDVSVLKLEEIADPTPAPGRVVVDIHACALNRLDLWVRAGLPNLRLEYPHILGSDVAGVVSSVGTGVSGAHVGREVVLAPGVSCGLCEACLSGNDHVCREYALLGENVRGGYAQKIDVPQANLLPKPARLSMVEAAALPLTFVTAWDMLVVRGRICAGDTVLIHAAGSGVGSAGLQIAKLHGARVVALASTETKLERARALGADATVLSSAADWPKQVRAISWVGRRGLDIVFEHIGQSTWAASLRLARYGGRVVTCGASSGPEAVTDLRHVFFRHLEILGSKVGSKASLHRILALVQQGSLDPIVDRTFPLAEAARAHEYLDRREQFGKVVLEVPH